MQIEGAVYQDNQEFKLQVDENSYETLCKKQKLSLNKMKHHNYEGHLVRRNDVLNQLLKLYKQGLLAHRKLHF
jgi:transposase